MERTVVNVKSPLRVTYTFYPAADPRSERLIVVHHGICHTRDQFEKLIEQLVELGFHVAMIEQQSEAAGPFRNAIGLGRYRRGMAAAVTAILNDEVNNEGDQLRLVGYVLHSMGALIGEEMQQRFRDLRRPTVLMAPIPAQGVLPTSLRIFWYDPPAYLKAVFTLSVHSLVDSNDEVQQWFFDDDTPNPTLIKTAKELKHAPFWSYCQLVLRPLVRPWIKNHGTPKLLLYSETDRIFKPWEYVVTRWLKRILFQDQPDEESIPGGHDFFIEHAEDTADLIAAFFKEHGQEEGHSELGRISPRVPGE
jgi:pimeloyl-ACP methyl ester carboxylesterase